MEELLLLGGLGLLGLGLAAVPGWLAVAGFVRWRRGTPGGRRAALGGALLAPLAAALVAMVTFAGWRELARNYGVAPPPSGGGFDWLIETGMVLATAAFPFGLALVALAGRAALAAAAGRTAAANAGGDG